MHIYAQYFFKFPEFPSLHIQTSLHSFIIPPGIGLFIPRSALSGTAESMTEQIYISSFVPQIGHG